VWKDRQGKLAATIKQNSVLVKGTELEGRFRRNGRIRLGPHGGVRGNGS
jgi:hypothetical protein